MGQLATESRRERVISKVGGFGRGSWSVVVGLFAQTFNNRERQRGAGNGLRVELEGNCLGVGGDAGGELGIVFVLTVLIAVGE